MRPPLNPNGLLRPRLRQESPRTSRTLIDDTFQERLALACRRCCLDEYRTFSSGTSRHALNFLLLNLGKSSFIRAQAQSYS